MSRPLSPHERALWQRVAATVRPMAPKSARAPIEPAPPGPRAAVTPAPAPARPAPVPARPAPPAITATLDGSWDKRLRSGKLTPDRVIDLHDHNLERAHLALHGAVEAAALSGDRVILVITGKGRPGRPGRIRAELHDWLASAHISHHIAALRQASPRHGGSGAFYLVLRRPR